MLVQECASRRGSGDLALLAFGIRHPARAATLYWDTDGSTAGNNASTGANLGGAGIWSTANANWWNTGLGTPQVWTDGSDAVFWGTAGAVTASTVSANSLAFKTTGYSVNSGTLTMTGAASFTVDAGVTATIGSTIAGATTMMKLGAGTLILSNPANINTANTTAGGWRIEGGGTLRISADGSLGRTAPRQRPQHRHRHPAQSVHDPGWRVVRHSHQSPHEDQHQFLHQPRRRRHRHQRPCAHMVRLASGRPRLAARHQQRRISRPAHSRHRRPGQHQSLREHAARRHRQPDRPGRRHRADLRHRHAHQRRTRQRNRRQRRSARDQARQRPDPLRVRRLFFPAQSHPRPGRWQPRCRRLGANVHRHHLRPRLARARKAAADSRSTTPAPPGRAAPGSAAARSNSAGAGPTACSPELSPIPPPSSSTAARSSNSIAARANRSSTSSPARAESPSPTPHRHRQARVRQHLYRPDNHQLGHADDRPGKSRRAGIDRQQRREQQRNAGLQSRRGPDLRRRDQRNRDGGKASRREADADGDAHVTPAPQPSVRARFWSTAPSAPAPSPSPAARWAATASSEVLSPSNPLAGSLPALPSAR